MKNKTEKTSGKSHATVSGQSRERHVADCDKSRALKKNNKNIYKLLKSKML